MPRYIWGIVIAFTPIAIPFLLWPIWWLAGCEPRHEAVHCKNAEWYNGIAFAILSMMWLMFISFPVGLVVFVYGIISPGKQKERDT
jgi:hypothetical protein